MHTRMNYKMILARNVQALMDKSEGLNSHAKLAKHCNKPMRRVSARAIGYLLDVHDSRQPKLDTIVAIADAFRIPPWMLLHPDFNAESKAGVAWPSPEIIALAQRIMANRDTLSEVFGARTASNEKLEMNGWSAAPLHDQSPHQVHDAAKNEYRRTPAKRRVKAKR